MLFFLFKCSGLFVYYFLVNDENKTKKKKQFEQWNPPISKQKRTTALGSRMCRNQMDVPRWNSSSSSPSLGVGGEGASSGLNMLQGEQRPGFNLVVHQGSTKRQGFPLK